MRKRAILPALAGSIVGACAGVGTPPSLQPRAAEAIDPRLPVAAAVNSRPVAPALASRLEELVAHARSGEAAFRPLAAEAERLAAAAGAPRSESWITAQQALSAAEGARAPTTRALGDIDALGAGKLQAQGGLAPADLAAIEEAAAIVGSLAQGQADTIDRLQRRLGI